jgi:dephospho-CoA kinase
MIIGLTGMYCAGKNYVASLLEVRGLDVLDVDKLGHQVLETEKELICKYFGGDLRKNDGSLDRQMLGKRVYGRPDKLAVLEDIVHPQVNRMTQEWLACRNKTCVINAALLHRSVVFHQLNRIILVTAPFFTRLLRARKRDRLSWRQIFRRIGSQKSFNSQYFSAKAEIYIVENLSGVNLENRLDTILEGIN